MLSRLSIKKRVSETGEQMVIKEHTVQESCTI